MEPRSGRRLKIVKAKEKYSKLENNFEANTKDDREHEENSEVDKYEGQEEDEAS